MAERADHKTRFSSEKQPVKTGRPKGARDKLNSAFIEDLTAVWERKGRDALNELASKDPASFARVAASLQPKEVEHKFEPEGGMSDDRLGEVYELVQAELVKRKSNATVN